MNFNEEGELSKTGFLFWNFDDPIIGMYVIFFVAWLLNLSALVLEFIAAIASPIYEKKLRILCSFSGFMLIICCLCLIGGLPKYYYPCIEVQGSEGPCDSVFGWKHFMDQGDYYFIYWGPSFGYFFTLAGCMCSLLVTFLNLFNLQEQPSRYLFDFFD